MRAWRFAVLVLLGLSATASAQPARVVTLWASGRIARFDASKQILVIAQGKHEMTFVVRSETRLERDTQDPQPQPPAELAQDIGRTVRISYVTVSGTRVARRVVVVFLDR
jgi:hypothetical protein